MKYTAGILGVVLHKVGKPAARANRRARGNYGRYRINDGRSDYRREVK